MRTRTPTVGQAVGQAVGAAEASVVSRSMPTAPTTSTAPTTPTAPTAPTGAHEDMGAAARTEGAVKVFGQGATAVRALDGVTISFARGELTAIMGPSGSGKSTLLHCMAGLDALTEGRAWIGDRELTGMSDRELTILRRDHVGFVFQAYNLVPTLDALENIELPMRLGGRRPDQDWLATLVDVLGLGDRLHHHPSELSGGQQQRVAAARALASRPDLVFADEPTGNLDSTAATELLELIRRTVDQYHQTVVMVTHDPRAAAYADRVVFLADGRVVDEVRHPTFEALLDILKRLGS